MAHSDTNDLVCFTNCLLVLDNGELEKKDLWIDSASGKIVDAQVRLEKSLLSGRCTHVQGASCSTTSTRTAVGLLRRSTWVGTSSVQVSSTRKSMARTASTSASTMVTIKRTRRA